MLRHSAPFLWRQRIAAILRRRSFGGVLPRGRNSSINRSHTAQAASGKASVLLASVMP